MKYTVKAGDTLTGIAQKFNTTVMELHKANKNLITNIHILQVGWVLKIPTTKTDVSAALNKCLEDIENLESFKTLESLL